MRVIFGEQNEQNKKNQNVFSYTSRGKEEWNC